MALGTPTLLTTHDDTTGSTTYTTPSVSPTANALILIGVVSGTNNAISGISGNGITYTSLGIDQAFNSSNHRLSVYRGMSASPSAGTIGITFGSAASGVSVLVIEIAGAATGGTNGSSAIVQAVPTEVIAGAGSGAGSLAAFADATNNYTFAFCAVDNDTTLTPEAANGYTKVTGGEQQGVTPDRTIMAMWKVGQDTTPGFTFTGTLDGAVIAMELTATVAGGGAVIGAARYYRAQQ